MPRWVTKLSPQQIGIFCVISSSMAGLAYFALSQAPLTYSTVNAGALILGLIVLTGQKWFQATAAASAFLAVLMALAILATALFGQAPEGASRWAMIGPLSVQSSLILLPCIILFFVRQRNALTTLAMMIAAASLALQPDRAMAAVLLAASLTSAVMRTDRFALMAVLASAISVAVTLTLPDNLPAVPFVDQVYYTALDDSWLAGGFVIGGTLLLLTPALATRGLGNNEREIGIVFGATWLAVIAAAALGNYPTPVVGYSGAAILGYVLSLGFLSRKQAATSLLDPEAVSADRSSSRAKHDQKSSLAVA